MKDRPIPGKEISSNGILLVAANGNPSLLRDEYVWKFVRTPTFKKLYGDWENKDAEKKGKLLDSNGEPVLFVHGSDKNFYPLRDRSWFQRKFLRSSANLKIEKGMDVTNFTTNPSMAFYYGTHLNFCFIAATDFFKIVLPPNDDDFHYATDEQIRTIQEDHKKSYAQLKNSAEEVGIIGLRENTDMLENTGVLKVRDRRTIIPIPSPLLSAKNVQEVQVKAKSGNAITRISTLFKSVEIPKGAQHKLEKYIEEVRPAFLTSQASRDVFVAACLQ